MLQLLTFQSFMVEYGVTYTVNNGRMRVVECAYGILPPALIRKSILFPHMRDGREVYLCWRYGEKEIGYWHETDSGYDGRQSLEKL